MVICSFTLMSPIACKKDLMFSVPAYVSPQITVLFLFIGRFVTNHICPRRYVTQRSDRVQIRATKMVPEMKNYYYATRLKKLALPSLSYRRKRGHDRGI